MTENQAMKSKLLGIPYCMAIGKAAEKFLCHNPTGMVFGVCQGIRTFAKKKAAGKGSVARITVMKN